MHTIKEETKASESAASETNNNNKSNSVAPAAAPATDTDVSSSDKRKKFILGKGYSLMDWIRHTKEVPDLAGNKGIPQRVTPEELAKHNKIDDCWLAIYDKVYNVTPYMKYHPGGVDELMRGAGINATDLFNKHHPWVNVTSMLEKCLVGTLVVAATPSPTLSPSSPTSSSTSTAASSSSVSASSTSSSSSSSSATAAAAPNNKPLDSRLSVKSNSRLGSMLAPPPPPPPTFSASNATAGNVAVDSTSLSTAVESITVTVKPANASSNLPEIPVLDSYQSNSNCIIVLYSKLKSLRKESIVIDKMTTSNNNNFLLFLYSPDAIYKYELEIPAPIEDHYDIKISREGKVEISLFKVEKIHWWQMCPKLKFTSEVITDASSGVHYRQCELTQRVNVNHDTDLYYFSLPPSSRMWTPIGHHVYLRFADEPLLVKPYTVASDTLSEKSESCENGKQICLMIKHYSDGALTSKLKSLRIGSKVEISNYTGKFDVDRVCSKFKELFLICAGSGFTPMIRLLVHALEIERISKVTVMFFNKTSKDILWRNQLDDLKKKNNKLTVHYILSEPEPDWTGRRGRINGEMVNELIGRNRSMPYFCVCGSRAFNELAVSLLKKIDYANESIFAFAA